MTFSTSLKLQNGIQQNLTGNKISKSSTKFFWGRSEKQDGRPGIWWAEAFSTSLLKRLNRIQWNLTGSEFSTSSTKFVFFGLIGKTIWLLWPIPQKGCTLYSGARYVALRASCSFKSCHRKEGRGRDKRTRKNVVELEVQSPSRGVRKSPRTTPSKSSTCFGEPKSQPSPSSKIRTKCSSMIIMLGDKTSLL